MLVWCKIMFRIALNFSFLTKWYSYLWMIGVGCFLRRSFDTYDFPSSGASLLELKPLKALCLKVVNVSDDDIGFFLSLWFIPHVEILGGHLQGLWLENVPKLVEIGLPCGYFDIYIDKSFHALACCISQLEILTLKLLRVEEIGEPRELSQLLKLKKLNISMCAYGEQSIIVATFFIRASPQLKEFGRKLIWCNVTRGKTQDNKVIMHFPHNHLKVLVSGAV